MTTAQAIDNKLKQVEEFEAKYGENHITRSWRKCGMEIWFSQ